MVHGIYSIFILTLSILRDDSSIKLEKKKLDLKKGEEKTLREGTKDEWEH